MYPGNVVALLKEQAAFIKASMALMWILPSVCFIQAQTEINCGNKLIIEVLSQEALK